MLRVLFIGMVMIFMAMPIAAQLDVAAINEAYKAYDMTRNEGLGQSLSPDSGTLGWGEGSIIQSYAQMWETTGDTYWLSKIAEHFRNIMSTATDPDGDGFLSWQTATYSCNIAHVVPMHNVSAAKIEPEDIRQNATRDVPNASGHSYLIEFQTDAAHYQVRDVDTQEIIAADVAYTDGMTVDQIVPFTFKITGATHQGDRFMVRTMPPEPTEFTVHQGMFAYPVALFIEAVRLNPALHEQFGADADEFMAFINHNLFEKNEQDWLEMGDLGGAYRFQPLETDRFGNRIMPHNQFGALARAWVILGNLEGAHPLMADRAEKMVRYLHSFMELDEDTNAYRWHYWDWIEDGEPGASGWEDTSHAGLTMSLAIVAARRGLIFTTEDMERIANTWIKVMWNGDEADPKMAAAVDGKEPYKFSPLSNNWSELSEWDAQVYDLALAAYNTMSPNSQTVSGPAMLLSAQRCGEF